MALSKKILIIFPFLGLGSASFIAGQKIYRLTWPKKWFEPPLLWGDKLTFEQHLQKMDEFKKTIENSEEQETVVTLREVPMPGNIMIWAHEDDEAFWTQRSEYLKNTNSHIPYEINKLKSWCSLHLNTRIYVSKGEKDSLKFRISKDDHISVTSLASVIDISDIKNNCSRLVTNEEFYAEQMLDKESNKWTTNDCERLAKESYGSNRNEFANCLKSKKEDVISKALRTFIFYIGSLLR